MKFGKSKYLWCVLGLILFITGLFIVKTQSAAITLPYVFIGVGSGLFGHGLGGAISDKAVQNDPDLRKKTYIEQNDERNIMIADKAKGKAFDIMTFVFGALMVSFALMDIDMNALLLLVFAYILVHGFSVYYRIKFDREM